MWQKILLQHPKKPADKGFITLEVLVSIIIALAFVAFSMQALVLSMMLKVEAQEDQRADRLIQEDVETLNDLAGNLAIAGTCDPNNYLGGYAKGLWDEINAEPVPTKQLVRTFNSDGTITSEGVTLTLVREHISVNASYNDEPYRTLKIYYRVTKPDADGDGNPDIRAKRYVEVIPDVALECP